jgi:hypothetical protein
MALSFRISLLIELSPQDMQAWKLSSSEAVESIKDWRMMTLLSEVRTLTLTVYGTIFGDNSGAIELAKVPKCIQEPSTSTPQTTISEHMGQRGWILGG